MLGMPLQSTNFHSASVVLSCSLDILGQRVCTRFQVRAVYQWMHLGSPLSEDPQLPVASLQHYVLCGSICQSLPNEPQMWFAPVAALLASGFACVVDQQTREGICKQLHWLQLEGPNNMHLREQLIWSKRWARLLGFMLFATLGLNIHQRWAVTGELCVFR